MVIPNVKLSNGQTMPIIGLGTYSPEGSEDRKKTYQAVRDAIEAGYRHIDTAAVYGIEDEVGRAIADAIAAGQVKRDELFIVTKLWLTSFKKDRVIPALKESLNKLQLDYVDLYLMHWPMAFKEPFEPDNGVDIYSETWPAMEEVQQLGLAKSIGISNFNAQQVDELMKVAKIKPVVNQVESHPLLSQNRLKEHCAKYGIVLTAYSPMAGTPHKTDDPVLSQLNDVRKILFENELIQELAKKYHKSVGQILLKYQTTRGISTIPKSSSRSRIIENIDIFDFELTDDELAKLEGLNQNRRFVPAAVQIHFFGNHKDYPFNAEF